MKTITELEEEHMAERAQSARAGYIQWRMRDVPSIYTQLMPPSSNMKMLWEAEQCIRQQIALDQKHLANPWRQIGQQCRLLDDEGMTPADKIRFGLDVEIPLGLTDAPKEDRWNELQDEIARQRALSPDYAAAMERLDAAESREQISESTAKLQREESKEMPEEFDV